MIQKRHKIKQFKVIQTTHRFWVLYKKGVIYYGLRERPLEKYEMTRWQAEQDLDTCLSYFHYPDRFVIIDGDLFTVLGKVVKRYVPYDMFMPAESKIIDGRITINKVKEVFGE